MSRISVKTDNSSPVKIKLSESAESPILYHVEIDRRRQNKPVQRESLYSREDVLGMICDALEWDSESLSMEPEPPVNLPRGTWVTIKSYDDDLMPRRRRTTTTSELFLDFRGVWRVFCLGEKGATKLVDVETVWG